jgi:hypothetical protein
MSIEQVVFNAEFSPELIDQAALSFREYRYARYGRLLIAASMINAAAFGLLLWLAPRPDPAFFSFFLFVVVFCPAWLFYRHFDGPRRRATMLKRVLPRSARVSVTAESVSYALQSREVTIPLSHTKAVIETQPLFLIVLTPFAFFFLPKSNIPAEAYEILHNRAQSSSS